MDAQVAPLRARHAARLQCRRGCAACCVDEITVFAVEAARIRARAAAVLREAPHAPGACAFLDDAGACRIYAHRPYVCRTEGLPLRWLDPEAGVEHRDICPLNAPCPPDGSGPPIESLPVEACWELGPVEGRLAALQAACTPGALPRVRLRSLFTASGSPPC